MLSSIWKKIWKNNKVVNYVNGLSSNFEPEYILFENSVSFFGNSNE